MPFELSPLVVGAYGAMVLGILVYVTFVRSRSPREGGPEPPTDVGTSGMMGSSDESESP